MGNTEGQKANARSENDIMKHKRAVVSLLSYPPGGGATVTGQYIKRKNKPKQNEKTYRLATHEARLGFFHITRIRCVLTIIVK